MKPSPSFRSKNQLRNLPGAFARYLLVGCVVFLGAFVQAQTVPMVQSDHDAYYPGESISVRFAGGPGGAKDWVGVYPPEEVPDGNPGSTVWRYVDNTMAGTKGLPEGSVTFPSGINLAGDWSVYLLLNDAYVRAASNRFSVVDPGTPLVRLAARTIEAGQNIVVAFTNGPANAKDRVGFYKEGQVPGANGITSTIWQYVDGTQSGTGAKADGTLTFMNGLNQPGRYVAYLLLNDGDSVLASETLTVTAPASTQPRVFSLAPRNGLTDAPPKLAFSATLTNGNTKVVPSSARLELDGVLVQPEVTTEAGWTFVKYTSPLLPGAGTSHVWKLTTLDDATPPHSLSVTSSIVIGAYRDIVLPAPIVFENFDALAEGKLPVGWTTKGHAPSQNEALDFGDLGSAAYSVWTTVNADRFLGSFVTYGDPANPPAWGEDYHRVLEINPFNVLNGQWVGGPLATGRFLFANSGYHNDTDSQVMELFTPDFNLAGKTNVHVAFKSLWEQNQDSIAALEYSVDRGSTWLPVAYFLDGPDIVRDNVGQIDAEETFNGPHNDVARYTDENGVEIGGTYGAFLRAPISPALAPYIQARVDNSPTESKRIEYYPLPQADNQTTVRLRFIHAGTDSWYWGIDDFGLYAIGSTPATAPSLIVQPMTASTVQVTFDGVLQSADTVNGPYADVAGARSPATIDRTGSARFFRARR